MYTDDLQRDVLLCIQ